MRQRKTQAERREESENRLLAAAAELIAQEGYAAASFDRVGQVSGYSRGLASQKFGSKDGLIKAVLEFLADRIRFDADVAFDRAATPFDQVLAYTDALLSRIQQDHLARSYFTLLTAAIANRLPIQADYLLEHNSFRVLIRDTITRGQTDGSIDPSIDPDGAAVIVGSINLGIAMETLLDPDLDLTAIRAAAASAVAGVLRPERKSVARKVAKRAQCLTSGRTRISG